MAATIKIITSCAINYSYIGDCFKINPYLSPIIFLKGLNYTPKELYEHEIHIYGYGQILMFIRAPRIVFYQFWKTNWSKENGQIGFKSSASEPVENNQGRK